MELGEDGITSAPLHPSHQSALPRADQDEEQMPVPMKLEDHEVTPAHLQLQHHHQRHPQETQQQIVFTIMKSAGRPD